MNVVKCAKVVDAWLAVALLSFAVLTACGTLEVGIEHTPTPDHAATATVSALATENARLATQVATLAVPTSTPTPSLGKLAYVQGGDVWVKTLPDGEPQRLTTDGRNSTPCWSPSGEWLAFRKDVQVWLIRADGSDLHPIDQRGPVSVFAWSPVEDRLACVAGSGILRLEVINADGTDPATLIPLSICASGILGRIAWSPDGRWIAYGWREELTYQGLWKISADGEERSELYASGVPEKGDAILAGWSLDNQYILFWQGDILSASMLADGVALYSLPADGGGPTKLTDTVLVHDDFLALSPQGDRLAVTAGGYRATWTNKRLAVVGAGDGELAWLTDESVVAFSPAWSPDSVHLAYVAMPDRGDLVGGDDARLGMMERRIWVVNTQGEPQLQQLTDDPAYRDERPLWSADGSHILFARLDNDDQASLWLIPVEGGGPQQVVEELTPLPGPAPGWFGYYGHVEWDQLFDWWRGPTTRELSLSHRDQLSAEILDTLAAYQPVTDAQPTVAVLLSNIARWLDTGGKPSDLVRTLNEASDRTEGAITATELDLTADGRDDVVVRIPIMGLPLLVFLNTVGPPAHFEGYALPPDLETIQHDWPVELTAYEIEQPALQLTDLTGDDVPEVLFNSVFVGGSSFRLCPRIFQWYEGDFRLIFAAELVSWAGYSTLSLEPSPVGGQVIHLAYPVFLPGRYPKGGTNPQGEQFWRWDEETGRYQLAWQTVGPYPMKGAAELDQAEEIFRVGDYTSAVELYESFLTNEAWQRNLLKGHDPALPNVGERELAAWLDLAHLRRGLSVALSGHVEDARTALAEVKTTEPLVELAQAFLEAYGAAGDLLAGLAAYEHRLAAGPDDELPGELDRPAAVYHAFQPQPDLVRTALSQVGPKELVAMLEAIAAPIVDLTTSDLDGDGSLEVVWLSPPAWHAHAPNETPVGNWQQAWVTWHDGARWQVTGIAAADQVELLGITPPNAQGQRGIQLSLTDAEQTRQVTLSWDGEVKRPWATAQPSGWPVVGWPDS